MGQASTGRANKGQANTSLVKRSISIRLIPVFLMSVLCSPIVAAEVEESEATGWLNKMAVSLHEQDYEGTFTYMRGSNFTAMEIAHKFQDGKELERLLQLNGEKLEIMRVDDEIVCYHENSEHVDLDHHVPMGPFSSAFSEKLTAYQEFYRFSLHGEGRIAGRPVIKLAVSPKYSDRYGYRLWLDKETGLLLQSHLIDVDTRKIREIFQFSAIRLGDAVSEDMLLSSLHADAIQHRLSGEVVNHVEDVSVKPQWRVAWVPNGFRAIQVSGSNRLHFTDGLATFSIFIEHTGAEGSGSSQSNLPAIATQVGGTVVISRPLVGALGQITVIGEVPITTARRVAESVEPVIY
ncbi:MAG: MucB/RseB C-terminal domain-containing protein [Pseudomonadales bacterium]